MQKQEDKNAHPSLLRENIRGTLRMARSAASGTSKYTNVYLKSIDHVRRHAAKCTMVVRT